jgi:hypothetical protein
MGQDIFDRPPAEDAGFGHLRSGHSRERTLQTVALGVNQIK